MKTDILDRLREIYPDLSKEQKELFSEVAVTIKALREAAANPLPEAPASATYKVVNPENQMECLVTVRETNAGKLLIGGLPDVERELARQGFIAFDAYVDRRREERRADQATTADFDQTNWGGNGQPPVCSTHNKPMKESKYGGWYCTAKIADDDGTGNPLYCKNKVKA